MTRLARVKYDFDSVGRISLGWEILCFLGRIQLPSVESLQPGQEILLFLGLMDLGLLL